MDMPRIFILVFFNQTSDSSLIDSVPYGKFYLLLTFRNNLQFRFYKKIRMVLVAVQVPQKKKTWNLVLSSFFQINYAFGFENQIWLWTSFE
jgi:hypothetical protein